MENENTVIEDVVEETEGQEEEQTTFTQADVDSQISKAVQTALQNREKKYAKELKNQVAQAVKEAQDLAKMTEEERINAGLQAREQAIAQREAEADRKEFLADVRSELSRVGLPINLAELVVNSTDRDGADTLIQQIKADWDGAIKETVKASARQVDPKASETTPGDNHANNLADFAKQIRKVGN